MTVFLENPYHRQQVVLLRPVVFFLLEPNQRQENSLINIACFPFHKKLDCAASCGSGKGWRRRRRRRERLLKMLMTIPWTLAANWLTFEASRRRPCMRETGAGSKLQNCFCDVAVDKESSSSPSPPKCLLIRISLVLVIL